MLQQAGERKHTTCLTLCGGCRVSAQLDRALGLARQMRARGVRGNVFSYSALLNVCVKCGQLDVGLEVWSEMERNSVPLNARPRHLRTCACLRGCRVGCRVWSLAACISHACNQRKACEKQIMHCEGQGSRSLLFAPQMASRRLCVWPSPRQCQTDLPAVWCV